MSKVVEGDFTDTLMAYVDEFHVPSGDRHSTFYFRVPDDWVRQGDASLQARVHAVAQEMYRALNEGFRQTEPDDLSYMAVLATHARALSPEEEQSKPWMTARVPAVWEWTPCVVVSDDGRWAKVSPEEF